MRAMSWAVGIAMVTMVAAGCATSGQPNADNKEYMPPTSIYNILDSTALVYSNPAAGSAINDHPLRWIGFMSHPIGHAFDYGVNRPIYTLGGSIPYIFGYSAEDSMLDAQRH